MIVFDLRCGGGHVFEAWFASSEAYAEQRDGGMLRCPICGDVQVDKAVMAPAVAAKGNSRAAPPPDAVKRALAAMASAQADALKSSTWVGRAFADEARAMHAGEKEQTTIHGQASLAEARALAADGVPVTPLPFPVPPPETVN